MDGVGAMAGGGESISPALFSLATPNPVGFDPSSQHQDDSTVSRQVESSWISQVWEAAQERVKNLLMMGFMMWMAGSTVHLFSIGIIFSALWQPISAPKCWKSF